MTDRIVSMGDDKKQPATLADLLDLPAEEGLYESRYVAGSEPASGGRAEQQRRTRRVPREKLDPYLAEVRAGASDEAVARAAGVAEAQVARWRRSQHVGRPRGRPTSVMRTTSLAVELLGHPFDPVIADVRSSPLGGRFEAPEYVLRDGLEYELLVQFVEVLALSGYTDGEIATGIGIRQHDVVIARKLAEASR